MSYDYMSILQKQFYIGVKYCNNYQMRKENWPNLPQTF